MKRMKIEYLATDQLIPYENNPRLNDNAVDAVVASIDEFGFQVPIVIDKDNVIVAGHTRLKAAKKLGIKELPCVRADDLTDEQIKAYRLADNKVGELADWDFLKLDVELKELDELDIDMTRFGFEIETEPIEIEEDEIPEVNEKAKPRVKRGDVWKLGDHRLMCGDSTSADDINELRKDIEIDMVISDPPYGMNLDTDFSTMKGSLFSLGRKNRTRGKKYEKVIGDNEDFSPELISTFFDNFSFCTEMFLFGADYFAELLPEKNCGSWLVWDKRKESQADAIGSEFELVWSKSKHKRRVLRHDWFGFLSSENSADARHRVDPTQKPVSLIVDIINQWGKEANAIVDLYGGSGTTLIACEQLGRKCLMMELDPHYCDVIIQRWENLTGKKAVLLDE